MIQTILIKEISDALIAFLKTFNQLFSGQKQQQQINSSGASMENNIHHFVTVQFFLDFFLKVADLLKTLIKKVKNKNA